MIDTAKYTAHQNPGKFEGETSAAEYFWELVMGGDGEAWSPDTDENGEGTWFDVFTVDADEAEAWPEEFKIGDTVIIWECSQGFVTLCAYGTREAEEWHVKSWLGTAPGLAPARQAGPCPWPAHRRHHARLLAAPLKVSQKD